MRGQARDFIRHCHSPEERLAVVLIQREGAAKGKVEQKFYTARQLASEKVLRYLRFRNVRGADVYATANPLKPRVRRRRAGDIQEARWLYADIDERGPETLRRIDADARRGRIPEPTAVMRTSAGRYQVLWRIEACDTRRAENSLRALAAHYRTDPAATDCARVLRIPGFRSRKRGEEVVLERLVSAPPARIEDFERALPAPPSAAAQARRAARGRERGGPGGKP
ncbi:MAG: DNA-primase RepB domain-containing protein, partial [bacterium]|nr:DNA-primase RepB domain-containing protein [bacterium]